MWTTRRYRCSIEPLLVASSLPERVQCPPLSGSLDGMSAVRIEQTPVWEASPKGSPTGGVGTSSCRRTAGRKGLLRFQRGARNNAGASGERVGRLRKWLGLSRTPKRVPTSKPRFSTFSKATEPPSDRRGQRRFVSDEND